MAGGGLRGRAGTDGLDEETAAAAASAPADSVAGAADAADLAVAAEVSLAVAAKAAGENFPVALRVLPARWRRQLTALYGFARLVDDIGDEPLPGMPPGASPETITRTRLRLLDELQADVARIYDGGEPELDAIRALRHTIRECGIPQQPLRDLIAANRQDQLVRNYLTRLELERYCTLSANPVGLVVLHIVASATPERIRMSDKICTGLQLIEHIQDVAEDLANGRIYLPEQDRDRFGVTVDDLARRTATANVRELVRFEADRAAALLDGGAPLIGTLRGAARIAIAGYVAGGRAALKAIRASGYDVLRGTPKPRRADTLAAMASCYLRGR